MGDELPLKATGTGGRQSRTEPEFGNVYDHFAVVYEYADGKKGFHFSRQQKDCSRAYHVEMLANQGQCYIDVFRKHEIKGKEKWRWKGEKTNMYQNEHDTLFASIRNGAPFNDGVLMANSCMLAIWGRMVAYTGQTLTWEEALNSDEVLGPKLEEYSWDLKWPLKAVAKPGITKFS